MAGNSLKPSGSMTFRGRQGSGFEVDDVVWYSTPFSWVVVGVVLFFAGYSHASNLILSEAMFLFRRLPLRARIIAGGPAM